MWKELMKGTGGKPVPFFFANAAGRKKSKEWAKVGSLVCDNWFSQSFVSLRASGWMSTLVTTT